MKDILSRFIASARGSAAVEFAIVIPVLILLFLASVDAGRAIGVYMKVRSAAYTLGTITNICGDIQASNGPCQTAITAAGIQQITSAAATVLSPYSSSPLVATVSQLSINANGQATVSWSYSLNGTARSQGASVSIPSTLASEFTTYNATLSFPQYLIFGEISYTYTPIFTYFVTHAITLSDSIYVAPRNATCIQYINSC